LLPPGGLIPAYIRVRHSSDHAKMTVLNRLVYKDERRGVGTMSFVVFYFLLRPISYRLSIRSILPKVHKITTNYFHLLWKHCDSSYDDE
jgi:hypothetical protein